MKNPFSMAFGKKPIQFISRITQTNEIIEDFEDDNPSYQLYLITGVRGSGKTVMMSDIASHLKGEPDWVVVELNPNRDLLQSMGAYLYGDSRLHPHFVKLKLDFSALGFGVAIEGQPPITDIEHAISLMLEQIKKQGKRVLITVDEITNNEYVKVFTSAFQIFVRQDYPVFLLMTGLYDNIYELQNDKAQTFLYRAPKVILEPLNHIAMRNQYAKIFKISQGDADRMATLTKGYPFAFQVLGYLLWESKAYNNLDEILLEYDRYLSEYVYEKIWSELSGLDRKILMAMADSGDTKVKDIRSHVGMKPEEFSVYRERLKRKGIINTEQYGSLTFALPRFEEFIATVY